MEDPEQFLLKLVSMRIKGNESTGRTNSSVFEAPANRTRITQEFQLPAACLSLGSFENKNNYYSNLFCKKQHQPWQRTRGKMQMNN